MKHWQKFLNAAKVAAASGAPGAEDSRWERPDTAEIVAAYLDIVRQQVEAAGIPGNAVAMDVVVVGRTGDGRPALTAMLKLSAWSERATIRLLLGLPLFEAKIRRCLRNHWLVDVSHFAGLWLHPSAPARDPQVLSQLREMLVRLEGEQVQQAAVLQAEPAGEGLWSVPGPLETVPGVPDSRDPVRMQALSPD
ncbi:MAG: hypothetical protein KGL68_12260 [Burkholderiales bacterium]|nr:hypothetical protein [Burkholderiales bacterium]